MENTDKIQDKVVSMLDALQQGTTTLGDKLVKYTPDVVDAGLWVIRIDGIQEIAIAIFCLLFFTIGGYWFTKKLLSIFKDVLDEGAIVLAIMTGGISITFIIISITTLLNIWNWVAIFEPKLYLAKQIIKDTLK